MAVSFMRNSSGHNYRNSSLIVDLAMGQIPRSAERNSSCIKHVHHTLICTSDMTFIHGTTI